MSCYLVPADHIDLLLSGAVWIGGMTGADWIAWSEDRTVRLTPFADFDAIGRELIAANVRSVTCRYGALDLDAMPGPIDKNRLHAYRYQRVAMLLDDLPRCDALGMLALAVDCYTYQSCECDDWPQSDAARFCENLQRGILRALPGYDDGDAWPWSRPTVE